VAASHSYATVGAFSVTVTITDSGGATATAYGIAAVLAADGTSVQAQATVPFIAAVATIAEGNLGDTPGDFTATIDWGDGYTSPGLVTFALGAGGSLQVLGSSSYAREGTYPVSVTLVRGDGFRLNVGSTVEVSPAPD